ncbi:MAG TPA: hypothetical protein VK557_16085 [Pyrinomonadaceae bacterium]|nr:hypothetical protein [Pyrinomonadaceae bacterium]
MKKINLGIAVMTLLLVFLSSYTLAMRAVAQDDFGEGGDVVNCQNIGGNCCGAGGCLGPGTVSGCGGSCSGGGSFTCAVVKNGRCTDTLDE